MKLNILNQEQCPGYQPDPYILESDGKYYIYATHENGVQLYISENFTDWVYEGLCYEREGRKEYWAPAVMEYEGKFYMYLSTMPSDSDDPHTQAIELAVSDTPEGPFVYHNTLLDPFTIDAHAVNTPSGMYLFYCVNDWDAERAGTLIVADRLLAPDRLEGKPVIVTRATIDEEIFERDRFEKGRHWHTIEGAFYFREGDYHYVMYSGSGYNDPTYFIGYSTAQGNPSDLRELAWHKYPDEHTYQPLLAQNELTEGTGHNSMIQIDGEWWIVYHGRDRGTFTPLRDTRTMRADKVKFDGKVMTVLQKK